MNLPIKARKFTSTRERDCEACVSAHTIFLRSFFVSIKIVVEKLLASQAKSGSAGLGEVAPALATL